MTNRANNFFFALITIALFFLALGMFSSPTLVSGYHIFILIPSLAFLLKEKIRSFKPSTYILAVMLVWGLIFNLANHNDLIKASKSYQALKYYLAGIITIFPLWFYIQKAKSSQIKFLFNTFFFVIITGFVVGITRSWFHFDIISWSAGWFHPRSGGYLNYMRYGYGSAFVFLLFSHVFIHRNNYRKYLSKTFFYIAYLLMFGGLVAAQTRGAVVALLACLPFFIFYYKKKLALFMFLLGSFYACIIVYFSFISEAGSQYRFLDITDKSNTVRTSQYKAAIEAIKEKPIFGHGAGQFIHNVKRLKSKFDMAYPTYKGHSHNIYLEQIASFGFIGGILLALFFVTWFWEMIQLKTSLGWTIATYIIAFNIAGQVEMLFENLNSHLLFFTYAISQVILIKDNLNKKQGIK